MKRKQQIETSKAKVTKEASSIMEYYNGFFILPIRFSDGNRSVTCWLPLTNKEPANKKKKIGDNLELRKRQDERGGYYQLNGGKSIHVHCLERKLEVEKLPVNDRWNMHVSHKCHHWWCCNPEHLVQEPEWVNQMRKNCILCNDKDCNCDEASHPDLSMALEKCVWYTPAVTKKLKKQYLDESFLVNMSNNDKNRFKNWSETLNMIKELCV